MWIGIDDTDSHLGGCTTYLAGRILCSLDELGVQLIGFPRLVRLNPNIPWKTRGNGAVSFQIGLGKGKPKKIGYVHGKTIHSYPSSKLIEVEESILEDINDVLIDKVHVHARLADEQTNPGIVVTSNQFDEIIYWDAVQKIMKKEEMITHINNQNGWYHGFKNGRGVIGATASIAWKGVHDSTFELIAYRKKERWGTKRNIDEQSVIHMDAQYPSTFDNFDRENEHVNIMPHSPCPVLFGIRGDDPSVLQQCMKGIKTESFEDWLIFSSNQGTDDHLIPESIQNVQPFQSVIVKGEVKTKPVTIPGGHVIFSLADKTGAVMDCAAYEPTKQFREIVRQLEPGDVVKVSGGVRSEPFTVNLEKIEILQLKEVFLKVENPVCPVCGKHMKSIGKNQGFRCKKCKTKADCCVIEKKLRGIKKMMYEVPVCARRHLSKPIKRMKK